MVLGVGLAFDQLAADQLARRHRDLSRADAEGVAELTLRLGISDVAEDAGRQRREALSSAAAAMSRSTRGRSRTGRHRSLRTVHAGSCHPAPSVHAPSWPSCMLPDKDSSPPTSRTDAIRENSIAARGGVGASELDPDGVAGVDPVGADPRQHGRIGDLDDRAAVVLVDDDGVEHVALAARQQRPPRRGRATARSTRWPRLLARRPSPSAASLERGGDVVGHRLDRWRPRARPRPRSGRRAGAAAPWRGRRWRPSPSATASRPSRYGS